MISSRAHRFKGSLTRMMKMQTLLCAAMALGLLGCSGISAINILGIGYFDFNPRAWQE